MKLSYDSAFSLFCALDITNLILFTSFLKKSKQQFLMESHLFLDNHFFILAGFAVCSSLFLLYYNIPSLHQICTHHMHTPAEE